MPYELTAERREEYRATSIRSQQRKQALLLDGGRTEKSILQLAARLDANTLMPLERSGGLTCLSLFSGGGGMDLGFERAGFKHAALFEILDICGRTLRANRPKWEIHSGEEQGDVTQIGFSRFRGIDVVQGGPPCQPFSIAGKQGGANDPRNMWGEFVRCVLQTKPRAFVSENVVGLLDPKFESFVRKNIVRPLEREYTFFAFKLSADQFGVPQGRRRVFFVGFRAARDAKRFVQPQPTHGGTPLLPLNNARRSLGLPEIGRDQLAPTLRSGFTGPRNTTGVVNSKASLKIWHDLQIWPNGVQPARSQAEIYPPENGHFRMSIADCAVLQGFPEDWIFSGAVYQALGQIGNSVCPPVAYAVARQVARALGVS